MGVRYALGIAHHTQVGSQDEGSFRAWSHMEMLASRLPTSVLPWCLLSLALTLRRLKQKNESGRIAMTDTTEQELFP